MGVRVKLFKPVWILTPSNSTGLVWGAALVMAIGALAGGALGGRLAGRIKPVTLRRIVVAIGLVVAGIYFAR